MALWMNAQTSQVATLLHDGQLSIFYTGMALQQAYEGAVDGDVITLSAGMFNAVNIEKNITIRGAGMGLTASGKETASTIIDGIFDVSNPAIEGQGLTLEGLNFTDYIYYDTLNNVTISKCRFSKNVDYYSGGSRLCNGLVVSQSIFEMAPKFDTATATFTNCLFKDALYTGGGSKSSYEFNNCILIDDQSVLFLKSSINNSIISCPNIHNTANNHGVKNCILVVETGVADLTGRNHFIESLDKIFKDGSFYELTDEALQYKGSDGRQVGIHGGALGFDPVPAVPQIVKFDVPSKTTADGKLSVDIEIAE